jgi:hypothetical protein
MTTSESASASILESITLEWYQWPQLSDRQPTPAFYQPLFDLCLRSPGYTFGNPSAEYYNSSFFIAVPLWFLEFAILSPHEGPDAPTYVGNARCDGTVSGESSDVIRPARRKVLRVCSLMVP